MTSPLLITWLGDRDHHDTGRGHPERPARIDAVAAGYRRRRPRPRSGVVDRSRRRSRRTRARARPPLPRRARTLRRRPAAETSTRTRPCRRVRSRPPSSRPAAVWRRSKASSAATPMPRSWPSARRVITPPGARGQGFCLLNNIAVAAASLAERGERVLIVDWDVHHGNGTQEIFWDDPRVLYVSTHQSPAYPGTGSASETGGATRRGRRSTSRFLPAPPATWPSRLSTRWWRRRSSGSRPTWVLVSAGFDAHRDDPLADLAWSAGDYAALAGRVARVRARARSVHRVPRRWL